MAATKIATCCYCGTKAALVLRGKDKHELSCSRCGAPLRALKMLPTRIAAPTEPSRKKPKEQAKRDVARPHKRRKRKNFGKRMFEEIWDVLEDVGDEVFD